MKIKNNFQSFVLTSKTNKMKISRKIRLMFSIILVIMLSAYLVSAFGVATTYWEENPLKMYPGETKTIYLNLQNKAGATEDEIARITVINGSEISSLEKNEYIVKAGGETNVPVEIKIPSNIVLGTVFKVKMMVNTVTFGQAGALSIGTGMGVNFDVIVGEKPAGALKPSIPLWAYALVVIAIIAILLYFVLRKKKLSQKK